MTGPEHYAEAERLLALADRHTRGVTYDQEWTLTLTAAQVHATLALAAATAVRPGQSCLGRRRRHQDQRHQAGDSQRELSGPWPCIAAPPAPVPAGGQAAPLDRCGKGVPLGCPLCGCMRAAPARRRPSAIQCGIRV